MKRRGFFGVLFGGLAGLFGGLPDRVWPQRPVINEDNIDNHVDAICRQLHITSTVKLTDEEVQEMRHQWYYAASTQVERVDMEPKTRFFS